jgi:hypothetical protein
MPLRGKTGVPITALSPAARTPVGATLNVPLVAQTQNQWCWACTAMIAGSKGWRDGGCARQEVAGPRM